MEATTALPMPLALTLGLVPTAARVTLDTLELEQLALVIHLLSPVSLKHNDLTFIP